MRSKRTNRANREPKEVPAKGDDEIEEMETIGTGENNRKRKSTEVSQEVKLKNKKEEEPTATKRSSKQKKKMNKKKNKPLDPPKNGADNDAEPPTEGLSLAYLKLWKEDREKWKFQKLRQIWLNENMLDDTKIPDDIFPIWIEYMEGSSVAQKKVIVKKATEVLKELEEDDNTEETKDVKFQRARMIIQLFDDDDDDKTS